MLNALLSSSQAREFSYRTVIESYEQLRGKEIIKTINTKSGAPNLLGFETTDGVNCTAFEKVNQNLLERIEKFSVTT